MLPHCVQNLCLSHSFHQPLIRIPSIPCQIIFFSLHTHFTANQSSSTFLSWQVQLIRITFGCNLVPCNVIIFLVFLSNSFQSSTFLSTLPVLYLRVATAMILFFPLNFVLSTYFRICLYSFEDKSFVSFSFNSFQDA